MYTINCTVQGTAPLMQHKFPMPSMESMSKGSTKSTGAQDYTMEWKEYFYSTPDGDVYQPAAHFEAALVRAATNFKVTGKRGRSYKELFKAAVFVTPEAILHGVKVPTILDTDGDKPLYLDMRPVVVNRARVVRIRPTFKPGWELSFTIEVIDDSISPETVNDVLTLAGKTVGVGDFRPRFGRFMVTQFEMSR